MGSRDNLRLIPGITADRRKLEEGIRAWYELNCPSWAHVGYLVEVTAPTDDESVKKVISTWSGSIKHYETIYDTGWKQFTYKIYAGSILSRVEVKASFRDERGWLKETEYCWIEVVSW